MPKHEHENCPDIQITRQTHYFIKQHTYHLTPHDFQRPKDPIVDINVCACAGKELQGRSLLAGYPDDLCLIQLDIYTEESYPYMRSPYINTCSSNTIEWDQERSLISSVFFSIYGFLSDGESAQEWAHPQHICSPCVAESHILFWLPEIINIYFLLDSPTELLQQRAKQVRFHSAVLI